MTLDEAIKHAEEVAEEQEKAAKEWHENQVRKCELFPFTEMDYTHENECKECSEEHRQLAEWLKELKQLREQTRWIPVSERVPKENETVVASTEYGVYPEARYTKKYDWEGLCDASADYWEKITGITAWKPSPKPYKPEKEGNDE